MVYLLNDGEDDSQDDEGVACKYCGGTGLHWQKVTAHDGMRERSLLFTDRGRRHVCAGEQPNADDFEVAA